ncbi:hypothetical protein GCM10010301_69210 [Streptomyces plicatus]|nr:hypothetical protein GCM10010301_69210 [Streptomyces plicatus]
MKIVTLSRMVLYSQFPLGGDGQRLPAPERVMDAVGRTQAWQAGGWYSPWGGTSARCPWSGTCAVAQPGV